MKIKSTMTVTVSDRDFDVKFDAFLEGFGADRDGNRGVPTVWFNSMKCEAHDGLRVSGDTLRRVKSKLEKQLLDEGR